MRATSDLIETLVRELEPLPRAMVERRLALGLGTGLAVAVAVVLTLWGPRPDFAAAIGTGSFWSKFAVTGLLAGAGWSAAHRLARPGGRARGAAQVVAVAVALMAGLAGLQLLDAPAEARRHLLMGATAAICPWLIMALAVPGLAGGFWAMRALAPTRLGQAGAAIGLAAGASAAFVYAISCDEGGMPFVLVWYGLGIAVPTLAGAALGRSLLRW